MTAKKPGTEKEINSLKVVEVAPPDAHGVPSEMSGKEPFSKEKPSRKRVLIACEESQTVCMEFRKLGFEAFSCDILPCSGGHPEWHIQDDVLKHLNDGWDLMIAHPPCTHLCSSGARWFKEKIEDGRQQEGIDFFMALINAPIKHIAVENPIGIMSTKYRKPDQIIQPFQFGDNVSKSTCLWLKNLPKLKTTKLVEPEMLILKNGKYKMSKFHYDTFKLPSKERSRVRSKTFSGIAKAMAEQWGTCEEELK